MAQSSANWEDPDFDGGDPETNSASNADDTSGSPSSAITQSDRSGGLRRAGDEGAEDSTQQRV